MPVDRKYGRVTLENQRNIGDDEPVVVFRAQDALLLQVLDFYAEKCATAGSPSHHIEGVAVAREAVVAWQREHRTQVPRSDSLAP